jgi:tripartite-type tricarboxylate transporter receptor subunit TctC
VAVFAPAAMKGNKTLTQVGDAVRDIMALPDVRKRVIDMGAEVRTTTAEGLADIVASDLKRWGTVIRQAGIKAE